MREEVEEEDEGSSNWFSRWEDDLPKPEELMPLTQSLITPDLANAFDIATTSSSAAAANFADSSAGAAGAGGSNGSPSPAEEPARTLKRPRLVWTPQLHKRFVDAVAHLGIKNAVPKTIMQLMGVDGLTRENVASHLQKYRLYLKRMQSLHSASSPSSSSGGGGGGPISAADHQLFASTPVPHHFLGGRCPPPEPFGHLGPAGMALPQQHQYAVPPPPPPYYQQRQMGGFGSGGGFEHGFSSRGPMPMGMQGMGVGLMHRAGAGSFREFREDLETGERVGGRRELALFPTGED